ncbi:UNVERIFIED_CONTAM: hypothetical protein FKN15_039551 [Acipenser sinensis]
MSSGVPNATATAGVPRTAVHIAIIPMSRGTSIFAASVATAGVAHTAVTMFIAEMPRGMVSIVTAGRRMGNEPSELQARLQEVSESVGAPTTQRMDLKELMEMINRNTAAQIAQTKKWRQELGLPDPEPTELELLLQKWEQASVAPQSPEPEGEELPLPEPRGEEPPLPEPRGEEPQLPEPRGEEPPLPEPRGEEPPLPEPRGEEGRSIPPPQPRPPPLQSSSELLRPVPQPLLLDTLPVFLDLPVLDLEPRSLQHWPQLCPWFPAPLSPSTRRRWAAARRRYCSPWVIGHRCAGSQGKTWVHCGILQFPGLCFGRPCQPGGVPCRRKDRPILKPARARVRQWTLLDLRLGGLLRVEGGGRRVACVLKRHGGGCVRQQGGG